MSTNFKKKNEEVISIKEMNEHLAFCSLNREDMEEKKKSFSYKYFKIKDGQVNFELTFKNDEGKTMTYRCRKDYEDENEKMPRINGMEAYRRMQLETKYSCGWKVSDVHPDYLGKSFDPMKQKYTYDYTSGPFLYSDKEHNNTWLYIYEYDMNSAYAWAMLQPIPDTSVEPKTFTYVGENEIGFNLEYGRLDLAFTGEWAYYVFPLMESPFKSFVEKYYTLKKTATDPIKKQEAKDTLNFAVGQLQNHNPFIRATILGRCNKLIKSLMDENTIMCNTDAIYSLTPRPDLEIGTEVGQWKVEYEGWFRKDGLSYQTAEGVHIRGVCSKWFSADNTFILGESDIPKNGNEWEFNKETMQLERVVNNEVIDYEV